MSRRHSDRSRAPASAVPAGSATPRITPVGTSAMTWSRSTSLTTARSKPTGRMSCAVAFCSVLITSSPCPVSL